MILVIANAGRGGVDSHIKIVYPHIREYVTFILPRRGGLEGVCGIRLPYVRIKSLENLSLGFFSLLYLVLHPGLLSRIKKIHAHNPFALLPLLPLKVMGKDIILSMHMWASRKAFRSSFNRSTAAIPAFIGSLLSRIVLRYIDTLIVLSEESESFYRKKTGAEITVIPNAIDVSLFRELSGRRRGIRERYGVCDSDTVICFAGRLECEKNPLMALEIFEAVRDENMRLWVMGDGSLKGGLRDMIDGRGLDGVELLGWLDKTQVYERLTASDIYIQPSEYEMMSMGLLEAAAAGNTCISSFIPGELEDLSGIYKADLSVDAFTEFISKSGGEMRLKDRWMRLKEFTPESCASRLLGVYDEKQA